MDDKLFGLIITTWVALMLGIGFVYISKRIPFFLSIVCLIFLIIGLAWGYPPFEFAVCIIIFFTIISYSNRKTLRRWRRAYSKKTPKIYYLVFWTLTLGLSAASYYLLDFNPAFAYLLSANAVMFLLFLLDKMLSFGEVDLKARVPEKVMLHGSFFGGAAGAFVGVQLLRHKTKKEEISYPITILFWSYLILFAVIFLIWGDQSGDAKDAIAKMINFFR